MRSLKAEKNCSSCKAQDQRL